jgi:hypothetical protein
MRNSLSRLILLLLTVSASIVGAWAQFAPRSFYESFPGSGRHWVDVDGPFNEHLIRDVGGLNLALALVTLVAAVSLTPALVLAAAGAWLVYSIPHLVYHAANLEPYSTSDQVANMVSLGLTVLAPAVVLVLQSTSKVPPARQ